ncbi:MAG: hypothetical protein SOT46_09780 [Treponema sp.]|nr:hypothetical protein [Spirochaetia bacterium]MDY2840642.1 hypothetical protein [Treponema sp.]MDY5123049.1 hypothetical protein [Treponema sp.]
MGKKKTGSLNILYLIGMVLTVVGFCLPMITGPLKGTYNGFKFINFDNSGFVTIGALVLFIGACIGAAVGLLSLLGIKIPSKKLLALVAILVVLAGACILVIGFASGNGVYKFLGKQLFKHATYGFYMVIGGWVVSLIGFILK